MRIAITGGGGFVGAHLTTQLRAAGNDVTVFARRRDRNEFSLEGGPAPGALAGFDALIHAAWDFAARDNRNIEGSKRLFRGAAADGARRVVFISSLSAFAGCRSQYGAAKLAVEEEAAAIGGVSVRLGFVCDDSGRGLSGSLRKLVGLPIIPLPGGGRQVLYTIQAEDLGSAFLGVIGAAAPLMEPIGLAHPQPVSLARMMRVFARQQKRKPVFLPIPWRLLWMPLRFAEAAGLNPRFRADSLVSLMNQNPRPDFAALTRLGIAPRAFDSGG